MDDLPPNEAAKIVANKIQKEKPHDRGWYRINATRGLTGGRKLIPRVVDTFNDVSIYIGVLGSCRHLLLLLLQV